MGKEYAQETAAALHGVAKEVRVLDLAKVWPEIPEHGDVSDMIDTFGQEKVCELISTLIATMPVWAPVSHEGDTLLSLFKSLETFPEEAE